MYTCEGPNDLDDGWPTEEELINFNETTEGKQQQNKVEPF